MPTSFEVSHRWPFSLAIPLSLSSLEADLVKLRAMLRLNGQDSAADREGYVVNRKSLNAWRRETATKLNADRSLQNGFPLARRSSRQLNEEGVLLNDEVHASQRTTFALQKRTARSKTTYASPRFSSARSHRLIVEQQAQVRLMKDMPSILSGRRFQSGPTRRKGTSYAGSSRMTSYTNSSQGTPTQQQQQMQACSNVTFHSGVKPSKVHQRASSTRGSAAFEACSPPSYLRSKERKVDQQVSAAGKSILRLPSARTMSAGPTLSMSALDRAKLDGESFNKAEAALQAVDAQRHREDLEASLQVRPIEDWRLEKRAREAIVLHSHDLSTYMKWDQRSSSWCNLAGTPLLAEATVPISLW